MDKVEQVKKIVATFLRVKEDGVDNDTEISTRTIKGSSIMLHRMYAAISRELKCDAVSDRKANTFGELLALYGLQDQKSGMTMRSQSQEHVGKMPEVAILPSNNISIGIDLEDIEKIPRVKDCYKDEFYRQNFSEKEISYCLAQPDPWQSFAGRFAAKEAIVKADNLYREYSFAQIEIEQDKSGKPYFRNFVLSISHNEKYAVAVAVTLYSSNGLKV